MRRGDEAYVRPFRHRTGIDRQTGAPSLPFYETGINYAGRDYTEGKKINWKDGLAALWFIFRYRFFD